MIKALVFDFDGLILDTESVLIDAWVEVHRQAGIFCDRNMALRLVGEVDHKVDWWSQFGDAADRPQLVRQHRSLCREMLAHQPLLPGVKERIEEAARIGIPLAIASNSSHDWIDRHLPRYGLTSFFSLVRCREDVARGKPEPDIYLSVTEGLHIAPGEAIAFEDSAVGVAAAKAAGLICVAVPNPCTHQHDFRQADMRVASLADLSIPELLKRW